MEYCLVLDAGYDNVGGVPFVTLLSPAPPHRDTEKISDHHNWLKYPRTTRQHTALFLSLPLMKGDSLQLTISPDIIIFRHYSTSGQAAAKLVSCLDNITTVSQKHLTNGSWWRAFIRNPTQLNMNGQTNVMLTLNTALYGTFDIDAAETTADSSPEYSTK